MKYSFILVVCLVLGILETTAYGQDNPQELSADTVLTRVVTYGGGEFIGIKVKDDEKVVVIETEDRGRVEIPKYEIETISTVKVEELTKKGEYIPDQIFATRYFIATNGLPIEKGESYLLFNLWGPDVSFGVADNLSLGVMTSWLAAPIIGTMKYSIPLKEGHSMALGLLAGHDFWIPEIRFGGFLPFAAYTLGDRKSNLTLSAGYLKVFTRYTDVEYDGYGEYVDVVKNESWGSSVFSLAGMTHITRNVTFVFDSWIMPDVDNSSVIILMPGLRFQSKNKSAFQFGFTGSIIDGSVAPVPIPMVQWFRKF